tara:strand:- start:161 stop:439 length:279 start_codon:yes stop_codon:yes gene_type:complete
MSRKKPVKIVINKVIEVEPDGIYYSEVVKSGNGAVIKFYKRFLNKKVIVIVKNKMKKDKEQEEILEEDETLKGISKKDKKKMVKNLGYAFTL